MDQQAPLTNVQAKDQVILCRRIGMQPYSLEAVERTTRTQIILSSDRRFRRKDGMRLGGWHDTWDRDFIFGASDENMRGLADVIEQDEKDKTRRQLVKRLRGTRWSDLSLHKIKQVVAILDKMMPFD